MLQISTDTIGVDPYHPWFHFCLVAMATADGLLTKTGRRALLDGL
jgi:hypothetical protein